MDKLFRQEIYKDKWLLIVGIPVITLLIQHIGLSWETIQWYVKENFYLHNICFNFCTIFLAFIINRALIHQLDQKLPYRPKFKKRVIVQLSLSLGLIITITEILAYLYVKVWAEGEYWEGRFSTDFPVTIILIILLNLIYIGFYLQYESQRKPVKIIVEKETKTELPTKSIEASIGNKKFLFQPEEIAFFSSKNKITQVYTLEGKRYLSNQSLKQVYQSLDSHQFFQANRQFIVNRTIIKGYQKLPNRKTELLLNSLASVDESILISKEKSPVFLKWLEIDK
ncbi:MAG: LytTR family DNA-binding domain-containing protein [Bacteroidota bacterium]